MIGISIKTQTLYLIDIMNQSQNEQQLIAVKLRSLQSEAEHSLGQGSPVDWLIKFGLGNSLGNVPRIEHLQLLAQIAKKNTEVYNNLFKNEQVVCDLLERCEELYDMAFVIEQHAKIQGVWTNGALVHKLFIRFGQICGRNDADMEEMMYLQGINMQISLIQSSSKEPSATFIGHHFQRQRRQAAKVYEYVLKPLFQKKDLKAYYMKLIGLTGWLVFMDCKVELVFDAAKKINSFILYHKNDQSFQMVSVCNMLFDWLSVHFPRESNLNHTNLAALLIKFQMSHVRLEIFFDIWIENRMPYINTLSFDLMFRNLTEMGFGNLVLALLGRLWAKMKENRYYEVLLKLFSGYIRKQYLTLWMQRGQDLEKYIKIAKYFMVGFSNRERFQGEEMDTLTNNICRHLFIRKTRLASCYREIIFFYALYENRFSYLSETSKRFFHEIQQKFSATIQTVTLHKIFSELSIQDMAFQEEESQYWQKGKISYRYRGLQNMGNTCYINSFMQCLFMTKKFRAFIHNLTKDNNLPSSYIKTYALSTLFQELMKKQIKKQEPFFPDVFRMILPAPFNETFEQQDTGQFGRVYLQNLSKQLDKDLGKKLQKLLFQKLIKTIRCTKCSHQKSSYQSVFDLILPVSRYETELYLSTLLQRYFGAEKFSGENQVFCSKCNNKQDAVSELVPDKMSEVVVFTLNLFDYVDQGIKILTPLTFEFTLNFDVLLSTKDMGQYQLYAFIVHLGGSLGGGHYICYIRNLEQNPTIWFCLDDGHVTEREIGRANQFQFTENETPYMLFYSKKGSTVARSKH